MERRQAAVFLDRDGTINEEVGYLDRPEKLRLIPGAAGAIRLLNAGGFRTVVVTNQSGIARGFFDEATVAAIHARLAELLRAEGASLDGFYFCPHHPTAGKGDYLRTCGCRKPEPGLLLRALEELRLAPQRSFMIGDTLKDIEAGTRAGVRGILVRTGYGEEALATLAETGMALPGPSELQVDKFPCFKESPTLRGPAPQRPSRPGDRRDEKDFRDTDPHRPHHVAADLAAAVRWILEQAP
jgi:D-glycero-D-manno-heptose 1,7-bisphosphate phosphatase